MKRRLYTLIIACILVLPQISVADWDPVLEAQEEQKRQIAAQEQAKRDAQAKAMVRRAEIEGKRKAMGSAAVGKSDDEIDKAYADYMAKAQRDSVKAMQKGMEAAKIAETNREKSDQALKTVTGKSMSDLQNMSEDELEALAKEMERKYGQ